MKKKILCWYINKKNVTSFLRIWSSHITVQNNRILGILWAKYLQWNEGERQRWDWPSSIFHKSNVRKYRLADIAAEAVRVPTVVHRLDHTADNELAWEKNTMLRRKWALREQKRQLSSSYDLDEVQPVIRKGIDSPHWWQQGANSIWKSCSQYFLPSNCQCNRAHTLIKMFVLFCFSFYPGRPIDHNTTLSLRPQRSVSSSYNICSQLHFLFYFSTAPVVCENTSSSLNLLYKFLKV